MFKNTKRVLAIMLAMAVIAMSMFTGVVVSATSTGTVDLLEFGDYLLEAGSTSKWYDTELADNGETGDSWENAIIIDNAEEFVYLAKASGDDTIGKYYKVADGIKGFDLSNGKLDFNADLATNLNTIKAGGKNHAGSSPGFQGHFDGNGATVYGAWSNHTEGNVSTFVGLFSCTKGNVTIKNINVKLASFTAKTAAGGIVGYYLGEGDYTNNTTLTIENCSVTESHLESKETGWGTAVGAIVGRVDCPASYIDEKDENGNGKTDDRVYVNNKINIKNCFVNLDEEYFISKAEDGVEETNERTCHGGVAGMVGTNALSVKDCVVIGIKPYATSESTVYNDVQHSGLETHFANVYTTSDVAVESVNIAGTAAMANRNFTGKVFPLTDDQYKGAAAYENAHLDWGVWMADVDGYPELRSMHKDVTFVDNGDGTHGEVCACGFGGVSASHIWVNNECACGAKLNCGGRDTIYWDGTTATGIATGSGEKNDPFVITSASELAWLINQKADVTAGKYYKIADNIGTIILQTAEFGADILAIDSADETEALFSDPFIDFLDWPNVGWEQSSFAGVFDGNGVTIYGLYQVSSNNAGLFSTVDAGAVIKNVALKNSYLTSNAGNYQVGGLAAVTNSSGYGRMTNGAIWFDSCVVANNYMYNSSTSHDRTGVIIGASSDMIYIDNCLVYGNNATYGDGVQAAIWSCSQNSQIVTGNEIIPEGLVTKNDGADTPRYYNLVRNSIILGAKPYDLAQTIGSRFNDPKCYENVYTDADVSSDVFSNGYTMNVTDEQIKHISVNDLPTLSLDDAWLTTTTYPELAVFHDSDLVVVPNNDGTHGAVCSCDTVFTAPCTYVDAKCTVCGADMTCASKRTIYWNGTVATGFADTSVGTKDDPIIISSADELAYLVTCKAEVTMGKYFEIAADIGTIILQPQDLASDILSLTSAEDVQFLFEDEFISFVEWPEKGWEQSCFAGSLEGNGVNIYGLYVVSDTNAGLFSTVDAGAAIHNIAILNSYMISESKTANYQVGGIGAVTSNKGYGADANGVVWIEGCTVGNCFMRNKGADIKRSGVIFGAASSDTVVIDNCLVYGNDARHSQSEKADYALAMPLINTTNNAIPVPSVCPEGLEIKTQEIVDQGVTYYYNAIRNTIAFGTDLVNVNDTVSYRRNDPQVYENCYTDGVSGTVALSNGEWTYEEHQIKSVTLDTLNENNLGDAWAKTSSYPIVKAGHSINVVDNGDGTHTSTCPCGTIVGQAEEHNMQAGKCTVCGAEFKCDHIAGEPVEENRKEPSCETGNGSYDTVVYCTVCGAELSRDTNVIPGGHVAGEAIEENRIDATCSLEGSYDIVVYCTKCENEISRETFTIEKLAHTAGEAVEENRTEATCSAEGSYDSVVKCTVCGEELSRETNTIEKLAHTAGEAAEENRIEATCVAEGSYDLVVKCTVCGEELSRTTETIAIDENAHAFDDENDNDCNNGCGYTKLVYGDANGDGSINVKDCALLIQYINGWDVADKINLAAADVNGDGKTNTKDYALMIQFINGWDVVLNPKA